MALEAELTDARERKNARSREHYKENRDRILARNKLHYQNHKERISKYWKERYGNHREEILARNKAYRLSHKQQWNERSARWRKNNLEKSAEIQHRWYESNKKEFNRNHRKYVKEHPEIYVAASQKRRALKAKSAINLAAIQKWMQRVRSSKNSRCYYCSNLVSGSDLHFDHIIPLSKGGPHTVENLCVSCAKCNLTKRAKHITAWVKIGQQVLAL